MEVRRINPDELYHHGIKGQRWGVRRYQNPDGSLTDAGKKRFGVKSDFNSAYNHLQYSGNIRGKYDKATLASGLTGIALMTATLPILSVSLPAATASAFVGAGASIATGVLQHIKGKKIEESKNSLVGIQKDLNNIYVYTATKMNIPNPDINKNLNYYTAANTAATMSKNLQFNNVDPRTTKAIYDENKNTIKVVDRKKYEKQMKRTNRNLNKE